MDESRIPKQLFYRELVSCSRKQGRQKKRYKDNLKANLIWTGIQPWQLKPTGTPWHKMQWSPSRMTTTNVSQPQESSITKLLLPLSWWLAYYAPPATGCVPQTSVCAATSVSTHKIQLIIFLGLRETTMMMHYFQKRKHKKLTTHLAFNNTLIIITSLVYLINCSLQILKQVWPISCSKRICCVVLSRYWSFIIILFTVDYFFEMSLVCMRFCLP